jgi:hypothetical protein
VKLSSVTDAYPGPDLDGRPTFKVAIIYEDSAAGKREKHFYDRVIRELVDECDFSVELSGARSSGDWRFGPRKPAHRPTS